MFELLQNAAVRRILGALVRHALTFGGGWLVKEGLASEADVTEVIALGAPLLVGVAWSLYQKQRQDKREDTALALPPDSTKADLNAAMKLPAA